VSRQVVVPCRGIKCYDKFVMSLGVGSKTYAALSDTALNDISLTLKLQCVC